MCTLGFTHINCGILTNVNYLEVCLVAGLFNKVVFWHNEALLCLYRLGWFCSSPWAILLPEMRLRQEPIKHNIFTRYVCSE